MNDKRAADVLIKLLDKNILNDEEKEAVKAAIGIFGWTTLAKSRLKAKKDKLNESVKW